MTAKNNFFIGDNPLTLRDRRSFSFLLYRRSQPGNHFIPPKVVGPMHK